MDERSVAPLERLGEWLVRAGERLTTAIAGPAAPLAIRRLVGVHIGAFFAAAVCSVVVHGRWIEGHLLSDQPSIYYFASFGISLFLAGFSAFGDAQRILLPTWAAFSQRRLGVRLGLLLAASLVHSVTFLLVMFVPYWELPSSPQYSTPTIMLLVFIQYPLMFALAAIGPFALASNWLRVGTVAEADASPGLQFRLATVMAIVTVFALLFGLLRLVDPAFGAVESGTITGLSAAAFSFGMARSTLTTFTTTVVALWATLGRTSAWRRLPVFAAATIALSIVLAIADAKTFGLPFQWSTVRSTVLQGAVVFGSLVVVRQAGFRLVWMHRDASLAGRGDEARAAANDLGAVGQAE